MIVANLLNALGPRELVQRLALAPGEGGAMLDSVFFVKLGVLERVGMLLHKPHPFDLLLEETECAAAARPPLVIVGQADPGCLQNVKHAGFVHARLTEGKANGHVGMGGGVALPVILVGADGDIADDHGACLQRWLQPLLEGPES